MKTKCGSGRNVDGFSFLSDFCGENQPKNICTNIWCFLVPSRFLHPFVYSVHARHVLMTILVWQWSDHCIPKLITHFQHRLMNPDILTR